MLDLYGGRKKVSHERRTWTTKHSDKSDACVIWKGKGNGLIGFDVHAPEKQGMKLDCRVGQESTRVRES